MKTFRPTPLSLALFAAFSMGQYGLVPAALLNLSQVPLFVTTAGQANVLLIFSNGNNMDEDPTGLAVGSGSSLSKSEIARTAARSLVANYTGKLNMGLMTYQQSGVVAQWLNQSPYDASYNPANYDATFSGVRNSTTKAFRVPNPTLPGSYVYYNVNLPFYSATPQGTSFCYSTTAHAFNDGETYPAGPWDAYHCYGTKTTQSDAAPGAAGAGYGSYQFGGRFWPTDSDLAQNILDFGARIVSFDVGPTWFANTSPGLGYLHVPVVSVDATQAAKLNTKLATSVVPTYNRGAYNTNPTGIAGGNTATNPNAPLQNAGLSPITGTFMTAKDYFNGVTGHFGALQGGPKAAPANVCGKDFAVFLTNGLPNVSSAGTPVAYTGTLPYSPAEVANAVAAVSNFNSGARPVKSYVIGFALPKFTQDYFTNNPPNPLDDMAAAGGTTAALYANDLASLNATFSSIFDNILSQTGAAAAVALTSGSVAAGGKIYQGQFNSADWSGDLVSYNTDATTGAPSSVAWHAGTVLNTQDYNTGRNIVTYKPSTGTGIPFRWPVNPASPGATELDISQSTALNTNISNVNDGAGQNRLDFIRGRTGIAGFRARTLSVLGDLVDSAPVYVGAPAFNYPNWLEAASYSTFITANAARAPVIYAGANDGMLHGFDASTGQEKIAYVPSGVYTNLSKLTAPTYSHRYFVDGTPTAVDTFYDGAWHTTLVSSLGAGGQSVFALDVTNPGNFTEANAGTLVKWEYSNPDLGYVYGQPSIVKLNNGKWAAVFSNGYNNSEADGSASATGYASLFIVDIKTGALIRKISTDQGSAATPNGLATPTLIDIDGDGKVDIAYAGDLLGNLWKFDLCADTGAGCSANPARWGVAFASAGSPAPLFVAKDASNNRQPITSDVQVTRYFNGDGVQLFFGTGKYLENSDITTTGTQTLYSLWDKGITPSTIAGRGDLQQQTVTSTVTASGREYRTTSATAIDWATQRGWYLDLPTSGERIVSMPQLYDNRIMFTTLIPDSGVCSSGGTGWLMEVDAVTGGKLVGPTLDVNGDGQVTTADNLGVDGNGAPIYPSGVKEASIPSAARLQKNPEIGGGGSGGQLNKFISLSKAGAGVAGSLAPEINPLASTQKRTSWRQIFE